jgi:hypothetical protein
MSHGGNPRGICDRCGFERPLAALRKEWTGLRVCNSCWEPRHPQDFVRGVPDHQSVPDPRPEPEPVFVGPGDVTPEDL